MKRLILVALAAIVFGAVAGGIDKWADPFSKQLISEQKVHIFENKKALRSVRYWKRQQMIEAQQSANPYYFGDTYAIPERCITKMICDYR